MRITFTQTVQYETGGRNQGPIFEEGSTHDFSDDFARRWLRRNVAVVTKDEPVAAPVKTPSLPEGGGSRDLVPDEPAPPKSRRFSAKPAAQD